MRVGNHRNNIIYGDDHDDRNDDSKLENVLPSSLPQQDTKQMQQLAIATHRGGSQTYSPLRIAALRQHNLNHLNKRRRVSDVLPGKPTTLICFYCHCSVV